MTYHLTEMVKKLRTVVADSAEMNKRKDLYRGMSNVCIADGFLAHGGTEPVKTKHANTLLSLCLSVSLSLSLSLSHTHTHTTHTHTHTSKSDLDGVGIMSGSHVDNGRLGYDNPLLFNSNHTTVVPP